MLLVVTWGLFPPAPPASDTCAERCRELKMGEFAPSGTGGGEQDRKALQ